MTKQLLVIFFGLSFTVNLPAQSSPPAAGVMLLQLRESDWLLQANALDYLAKHQVTSASKPIRGLVENEETKPWLRGRALVALTQIEPLNSKDLVLQFTKHNDTELRSAATEALQHLDKVNDSLDSLLKDDSEEIRYRALAAIAKQRGADAWQTVDAMTKSLTAETCQWAATALTRVSTEASIKRLTFLAKNEDFLTPVIRGVQHENDPKLTGFLLQVLNQLDAKDKRFADVLTLLQRFDEEALLAALQTNLKSGDSTTIRTVALVATLLTPFPELGDALRKSVPAIENTETIKAVLIALGPETMKPDRHRELFADYLNHDDEEIRSLAIRCLSHCRSVNLYEQLRERVLDTSPRVVETALSTLLRTPKKNAPSGQLVEYLKTPLGSEDLVVQTKAFELLAHAGTAEDFRPAMNLLDHQLRSTDDDVRSQAAATLGSFAPSEQIESVVRAQGYVAKWKVLGTFLNDKENKGFNKPFPPETKIDFNAKYKAKYVWALAGSIREKGEQEREIAWGKAAVDQTDGKLVIPLIVPPPAALAVAYAVADFRVAEEQEVFLTIDGDDAFRVWLNDKKVTEMVAPYKHRQPCVAEQKNAKVALNRGSNRIVVKTTNIDHQWWFRIRLTNADGQPVEIRP